MSPLWGKGYINVADPSYEAAGDGVSDDTAAFQAALDDAGRAGGASLVLAPAGAYRIATHLSVPARTSLVGVARAPWYAAGTEVGGGTVLLASEGAGDTTAAPFIELAGHNATVEGLTILYPDQVTSGAPVPYPYTIRGGTDPDVPYSNLAVRNVLLCNSYREIDLGTRQCGRALVQGVCGQPLEIGIYVDRALDTVRVLDCHFWPMFSFDLVPWTIGHGFSLWSARSDWMVVHDLFSYGYYCGALMQAPSTAAATNGQMSNVNFDACIVGMWLEGTQVDGGLMVSNLNVAGYGAAAAYGIYKAGGDARLHLRGASFWGPFLNDIRWHGGGVLAVSGSAFRGWRDASAVHLTGPVRAMIQGSVFSEEGKVAVACDPGADRVLVGGNLLGGNALRLEGPHLVEANDGA